MFQQCGQTVHIVMSPNIYVIQRDSNRKMPTEYKEFDLGTERTKPIPVVQRAHQ